VRLVGGRHDDQVEVQRPQLFGGRDDLRARVGGEYVVAACRVGGDDGGEFEAGRAGQQRGVEEAARRTEADQADAQCR
jgi:hypothetical protein